MRVLIDGATKAEMEEVIRWARTGANNCMIGERWNIVEAEDAVPVVRCKDCKWWGDYGCAIRIVDESDKPKENDFCSFGERKENETPDGRL